MPTCARLGVLDPPAGRRHQRARAEGRRAGATTATGCFPWSMLLCLPLFRRGAAFALLLACGMWLPMVPASAQSFVVRRGGSLWQRADQAEHARMQDGIAAYRQKDYPRAIERFSTVSGAEGQYNLGNALAKAKPLRRRDRRLRSRAALAAGNEGRRSSTAIWCGWRNNCPNARRTRARTRTARAARTGSPRRHRSRDSKARRASRKHRQRKARAARQASRRKRPPQKDPQSQAQADAAQRERMQQALQKQQAKQPGQQPKPDQRGKPQETAEQRERRLANEAWLQRVPDDPGALLRARFQLEQQRRRGATP
jgi:Ca-activated chloride channel family protein